jgi:D-aminoacyl-tRNA deacylase
MKVAIIVCTPDPAGMNIKKRLLENYGFKESGAEFSGHKIYEIQTRLHDIRLYQSDIQSIFNEDIDKKIDADIFIFATTHKAASGIHSLSVHAPGNWSKAELGGKDFSLPFAPSRLLRFALFKLEEFAHDLDFEIMQECTHHGPYLEKPVMFIEIGSNEETWTQKPPAEVIAKTLMFILDNPTPEYDIAFGIGGPHHTPNFKRHMQKSNFCYGHICPMYQLEHLNKEMVQQALDRSCAEKIFVDWKGLKSFKEHIKHILEGVDWEKIK